MEIGGSLAATEGGSSLSLTADIQPLPLSGQGKTALQLPLHAGALWFTQSFHPFASLNVMPRFRFAVSGHRINIRPHLNVTFTDVNSWLYAALGLGLTYEKTVAFKNPIFSQIAFKLYYLWLSGGSYPKMDSLYSTMYLGGAATFNRWVQVYTIPRLVAAAGTAMETAYVGDYSFRFQGIESGVNLWLGGQRDWMLGGFANYDRILSRYGARVVKYFSLKTVGVRLMGGLGYSRWSDEVGGTGEAIGFAELQVELKEPPRTRFRVSYEHLRLGFTPQVTAHEGNSEDLSPVVSALARTNMAATDRFAAFAALYTGADAQTLVETARWLGHTIKDNTYAYDALSDLTSADLFSNRVKALAALGHEDIYQQTRTCLLDPTLCQELAVCAGIHSVMADFLSRNGIPALAVGVNSSRMMHVVTVALTEDQTRLINYGELFEAQSGGFDEVLRYFSFNEGFPIFGSHVFRPRVDGGQDFLGVYETSEGILFHRTIGLYGPDLIHKELWGTGM